MGKKNILSKYIPFAKRIYDYFKKSRYQYLYRAIRQRRCRKIMEIGVYDGEQALKMLSVAKKFHGSDVEYFGFDLFEDINEEIFQEEGSKYPLSYDNIQKKLDKTGCKIHLYKGFTNKTLPENVGHLPAMDLIFIDGGHSVETIANDWKYSQQLMSDKTITLFDDYYFDKDDLGCKKIIEAINKGEFNVVILPAQNSFKNDWGVLKINFVRVEKVRRKNENYRP